MHVRGVALPGGEPFEGWTDGARLSLAPVPGARTVVDGGFLLPGLVDAHSHPGRGGLGAPLDEAKLDADLRAHAAAGITAVRAAGSPDRPLPAALRRPAAGLPLVADTGVPLGVPGQFPAGAGRIVAPAGLPDAAAEHSQAAGGWCKIYADWIVDSGTLAAPPLTPPGALAAAVRAVHAAGGRVAVHALHPDACRAVVEAGADTLEHGLWLDPALLPRMAAQGTALTPTITVWARQLAAIEAEPGPAGKWFLDGLHRLPWLAAQAWSAGVTVLAGTDSEPHGRVTDEIRGLARALPAAEALAAAAWSARAFLGLPPGLAHGARADLVAYPRDPREDLAVLDEPARVIVAGQLLR
ncbi:MAG TPA: amidohydrolase family protein [Streptosporangiaceae bacterium]|jgi:imidazolonepropionase-like amidohydrolase